jgi:16S rRNA processing protein RimM
VADELAAGHVGRPHGLDGSFHLTRGNLSLLAEGGEVSVGEERHTIVRLAGTAAKPIMRLSGATSREAVEALRGSALLVDAALALPLEADEYRPEELVGCVVTDGDVEVGRVTGVLALPSCEALEVERTATGELLVPLVRDAIRSVDVGARRIDVDMAFVGQ